MRPVSPASTFRAVNPATGASLDETFTTSTADDVDRLANLAASARLAFANSSGAERARLLRVIADRLAANGDAIVTLGSQETGLPLPRLQGELARTTGQLRLFAEVAEEGSWVDARIDTALPDRQPLPRPDVRSMLRPIGPVAVFGASNFPLAFSVAGGDTASALAAGNPVVVKAHPAHPGTSRLAAEAIAEAVRECGLPEGVFGMVYDAGTAAGEALVQHPAVQAVAFTGSAGGGQALMRLAASRPEPIPCFAEMGSTNPLFVLPGAMRDRGAAIATGLQTSFTLGSGQFCTKPGLVFVPETESEAFRKQLEEGLTKTGSYGMLTRGIADRYSTGVQQRLQQGKAEWIAGLQTAPEGAGAAASAAVFGTNIQAFLADSELQEEIFGPTTLLVHYGAPGELLEAAYALHGHLTATLHGTPQDLREASELIAVLETKVGRILFNGFPTGVEVCHAMVHGGPFPAASDSRFTSVGTRAMLRFARPVCYQDFPEGALPEALRDGNPLHLLRMRDGKLERH